MSVYKIRLGTPESFVPTRFAPPSRLPVEERAPEAVPSCLAGLTYSVSTRGVKITLPVDNSISLYGFGLQLKSFRQNGKKKTIRPNADPKSDSGDSHAPVPFLVTTAGFGLFVDTARYCDFYCNLSPKPAAKPQNAAERMDMNDMIGGNAGGELLVEIPVARGVDLYCFTGDTVLDVVSQYNLFSGGGCMPPLWGLGNFYRCDMTFRDERILELAKRFRELDIPCDVIGLEPGWQTHAYSCSYRWDSQRFPNPAETVAELKKDGFHVNLWEHAFTHPTAEKYEEMLPYAGDYLVWNGLVPDFSLEEAGKLFAEMQKPLMDMGVDGFKLDECDGSDFTGGWTFPNCASFPSGMDGEQYHSLFGLLYAKTMEKALGNTRTLSQVRNMGALAASYPFVLYSDLYGHREFLTGLVNAGFAGLLWSPEVRHAENAEDLLRRIQSVIFSPQSLVNAFYLPNHPWVQHDCVEGARELFRLRMSLLPYLYTAFYDYQTAGKPPVRALVCDYQNEKEAHDCSTQWLFGDHLIVAPLVYPEKERDVWLPPGEWYDFFTGEKLEGGTHHVVTDGIPVYVKGGTLLPFAQPVEHLVPDTRFDITLRAYGDCKAAVCRLVEDDGETHSASYRLLEVTTERYETDSFRYRVAGVEQY